jgi:hypothetical protein
MLRRILKEVLIVSGLTLFFMLLCATVGISTSTPPSSPTVKAADVGEHDTEQLLRLKIGSRRLVE